MRHIDDHIFPTKDTPETGIDDWCDKYGACKVCGGEIPHGHQNDCAIYAIQKQVKDLKARQDRIHKHAVAKWRYGAEDGWLKVMELSDPGKELPAVESGFLTALREIGYGEVNGVPNGGIMCRAIARAAIEDFTG